MLLQARDGPTASPLPRRRGLAASQPASQPASQLAPELRRPSVASGAAFGGWSRFAAGGKPVSGAWLLGSLQIFGLRFRRLLAL
eukprot:8757171-Prorocentrum_lima.AAC.1